MKITTIYRIFKGKVIPKLSVNKKFIKMKKNQQEKICILVELNKKQSFNDNNLKYLHTVYKLVKIDKVYVIKIVKNKKKQQKNNNQV